MAPLLRTATGSHRDTAEPPPRVGLAHLSTTLTVLAADALFTRSFHSGAERLWGRHLYDLLHPSAARVLDRQFSRLADGDQDHFTERVIGLGYAGLPFFADLTGTAAEHPDGAPAPVTYLVAVRPVGEPDPSPLSQPPTRALLSTLHARILEGIAAGASNIQLASRLHLSRQAIDYHVGRLLRQLRAPNRAALVARAHAYGMLAAGTWPPRVPPGFLEAAPAPVPTGPTKPAAPARGRATVE
ncbi:helix-turn-helix transcriptional regulator [Streptomyces broussonetiae]|uniref:helix-turn-helix transcriptional regulator n=1 Tax=Streptomyces broussonetiae TaxID=2686304 RepID=UPI0035DBF601